MTMQTRRRRLGMQNPGWESWVDLARNRSLHLQPPFGMLIIIMLIKMVIVRTVMIMVKTKLENAYPFHCWWQNCQMMQDYSSLVIVAQSWFVVDVSKLTPHWFSFAFVFQQINIGFINFEGRVVSLWCQVLLWLTIIFKRQTSQFAEMVALLEWGHDWSEKKVVCKITSMWFECYKSDGGQREEKAVSQNRLHVVWMNRSRETGFDHRSLSLPMSPNVIFSPRRVLFDRNARLPNLTGSDRSR